MMSYRYRIPDQDEEQFYGFKSDWSGCNQRYIAEDAAMDFYDEHDGRLDDWPIVFEVFDGDESLGLFEVELEFFPEFTADKKEPKS